ncbi:MAG: DNA repair protein RecN [Candidatus Dormibacteria bacterium]
MSLVELRIRNVAVFRDATVPVGGGFVALTGETGSGKSVCLGALRLALGGRVEGDPLSPGADTATVTAVFDEVPAEVASRLAGLGVPADAELLSLTRELSRGGRGSSRINGALVSASVLREVGEALAEITVQGASQRLLQHARQRDILDVAAGAGPQREAVRAAVTRWREAAAALEEGRRLRAAGASELEAARQTVADLEPLRLVSGEDDDLAAERLRLRHAAALVAAATALHDAAVGGEHAEGAADLLAAAAAATAAVVGVDPGLDALAADAARLAEEVRDLGASARRAAGAVSLDEGRLAEVEERLDCLARVRRRHGSIEAALAALHGAKAVLDAQAGGADGLEAVAAALTQARRDATAAALALSAQRRDGARRLEAEVVAALAQLDLPHARFSIALERRADPDGVEVEGATVACGPAGLDEVVFRLSTNRDAAPAPLDEGPSGGELSRLVLALAACVSETGSPLLVLDVVDTGVGGETAARVGDLLAQTGRRRQVLAVTHRAEIASRASTHLLVSKRDAAAGTTATVGVVEDDARLEEIARLMSGRVTGAALARAGELRGEAAASAARPRRPAAGTARRPRG